MSSNWFAPDFTQRGVNSYFSRGVTVAMLRISEVACFWVCFVIFFRSIIALLYITSLRSARFPTANMVTI